MGTNVMLTTGRWQKFDAEVKTVALAGLWGCTSVIAVSKRGVWVAHFWEDQANLVGTTLAEFQGDENASPFLEKGLGLFRGKEGENGNMFDDDAEPQVFVVSRGQRVSAEGEPFGTPTDADLVARINTELDVFWARGPNRGTQTPVSYTPVLNRILPLDDPEHPGEPIPPTNVAHAGDPEFFSFRGKALVQYQPALVSCGSGETIGREAGYRVWVEAKVPANGEKSWEPEFQEAHS